MSNPEGTMPDATQQEPNTPADSTPTTEELLAISEKRRKDTQAGYTKGQQAIKALEAEKAELMRQLEGVTKVDISAEDQSILDDLKYEDPDAWRLKMNSLESKAKGESRAKLDELTGEARVAAERNFELERRQQVLEEFNASAEIAITDEVIANDVPPRISNKLAQGTITFEEYLQEVTEYLGKGKTVSNPDTLNQPNLGAIGGGTTPTDTKPEKSLSNSYAGDIY